MSLINQNNFENNCFAIEGYKFVPLKFCFSGFPAAQKAILIELTKSLGHSSHSTVIKSLDFLVCGPNAGKAKLATARQQPDTQVIDEATFLALMNTLEV